MAIIQKKDGAWIIGIGMAASILTAAYQMIGGIYEEAVPLIFDYVYLYGLLALLISMSVYLARRFAQTNKNLEKLNEELEDRVEQRTEFIRRTFGRYLTDEVVENLLESPEGLEFGGGKRKVTILMSDLRGFSPLAEGLPPEKVVLLLNTYLGTMTDVILKYEGTIDEFIGDAILVLFGAPMKKADDAERAVACAVEMQLAMEQVNAQNRQNGLPEIEMGIGINTGEVVVGNIGSQKRAKYGVVGSHVNLTARIESYTVGGQILISEGTFNETQSLVKFNQQMEVEPKGVKTPITIYEVGGVGGKYNLFLPEGKDELRPLPEESPIRYTILEEKFADRTVFTGSLVSLSAKEAEVRTEHPVPFLSNLKITLVDANGEEIPGDLYGKVMESPADNPTHFYLRFTSVSSEVATSFQGFSIPPSFPETTLG
ncbi:MAG: adenylate/guanylate cyclase domain-containing protein [Candidatus Poribacteria bacterium]|nr:adenylate/guanylate cyclase domain-containing protein [Candidatus Poribacteria bacterium]